VSGSDKPSREVLRQARLDTLPADWRAIAVGRVAESQYGLSVASDPDGNVPILGMQHLRDGRVNPDDSSRVSLSPQEIEAYRLRPGDLLFNRTNSYDQVGKVGIFEAENGSPCVFASYLIRLKTDPEQLDSRFLAYFMNSHLGTNRLKALATPGVSQYNINPTSLGKHFLVPLPRVTEQQQIVEVLNTWDTAREEITQLSRAKRRLKRGLMQQLLTGERRFPEFKGSEWTEHHLGDLFTERAESGRVDLPLLAITGDRGVISREQTDRKDTSPEDKRSYKRIAPGDIGYNTMRMWQGVSAVSRLEGIVSPAYTVCAPGQLVDSQFMGHLFKFAPVVYLFRRYSQGLVDDTLNLKFHHFAQIKVTVPSVAEQRRVAAALDYVDQEISHLQELRRELNEQKRGLMQKLLTGQVRVKA
jgi:type I restriction enzyme S subunit